MADDFLPQDEFTPTARTYRLQTLNHDLAETEFKSVREAAGAVVMRTFLEQSLTPFEDRESFVAEVTQAARAAVVDGEFDSAVDLYKLAGRTAGLEVDEKASSAQHVHLHNTSDPNGVQEASDTQLKARLEELRNMMQGQGPVATQQEPPGPPTVDPLLQ